MKSRNDWQGGIGSLLTGGVNAFQKQQLIQDTKKRTNIYGSLNDPERPLTDRDLMLATIKDVAAQPYSIDPVTGQMKQKNVIDMFKSLKAIMNGTGYNPTTGAPDYFDPADPQVMTPSKAVTPSVPAGVSRGGYSAQDLADALRKRGVIQ